MSTSPDWAAAGDVFRKSYDEVLAAIKHQDDKLGRVLTVLAFLTTGGVALYAQVHARQPPISAHLWEYLLIAFLVNIAGAVILAVAGIDPTSLVPDKAAAASSAGSEKPLLFYESIANDPKWPTYIEPGQHATLREALARDLHRDTQVLARRVAHKIRRSNESQAFLQVAIVCVVLLGLFALSSDSVAGFWSSTLLLVAVTAIPIWSVASMRGEKFPGAERTGDRTINFYIFMTTVVAAVLLIARVIHHEAWGLAVALGVLLASRLFNASFARLV